MSATSVSARRTAPPGTTASARTRLFVGGCAGLAVGGATAFTPFASVAPLLGWITAAATFSVWTWAGVWRLDPSATAADTAREDPSRPAADLVCLFAAIASLIAVAAVLVQAGNEKGTTKLLEMALAVASVAVSWLVIHTVFTLRYARHYYADGTGSIDFNQDEPPRYSDFAYLAFTIGMTFQVSDTDLKNNDIRRLALRHMLLSYLMGAVIVAVTINLVAGMTK